MGWLRERLGGRWMPLVAAVVGVLLASPSLWAGLATEDWVFRAIARGPDLDPPRFVNLFGHDAPLHPVVMTARVAMGREVGVLPWHTVDDFQVSFWRPLASWTHVLDYRLLDRWPALMHAHSLLWYALLCAGAAIWFRRFVEPRWAAGVAVLLYAADDAHGHAVGWLANRNGVMAAAFGVVALYFHDRWRRDGWRPGALLGAAFLGAALLSGELALGAVGYFAAHALLLDPAPWPKRAKACLPWVGVVVGWALAYRLQGHGVSGSGVYLDPLGDPAGFVLEASGRGLTLLLGLVAAPQSDLWVEVGAHGRAALAAGGAVVGLVLGWFSRPLWARDPRFAFAGLGMLWSLLPACGAFPQDRLLFFPGLGAMASVAMLLGRFSEVAPAAASLRRVLGSVLCVGLLLVHGVAGPALLPWRSLTMQRYEERMELAGATAVAPLFHPLQQLFLLDAPDYYFGTMIPLTRSARGDPLPSRVVTLSGTLNRTRLSRLDTNAFELRVQGGLFAEAFDAIYRRRGERLREGQLLKVAEMDIRITAVSAAGEPLAASFRFRWPLESRALCFVAWHAGRYEKVTLPAVGRSVELE